jgi:DNA-binding NarL/FixJ family response regulator
MPDFGPIRGPGQCYRGLTPRERQVVALSYLSNAEIADQLGTCRATVKAQMRAACQKLGARNRTEAMLLGMRQTGV